MLREAPTQLPCFCLIDQRTFECNWETVKTVAEYKSASEFKIEIFYFLAQRWFDRAWQSRRDLSTLVPWWGRDDVQKFLEQRGVDRARLLLQRFIGEFGYKYVTPWSIHDRGNQGRTMFYMIHASDHPRATRLMSEAYNAVNRIGSGGMSQIELFCK